MVLKPQSRRAASATDPRRRLLLAGVAVLILGVAAAAIVFQPREEKLEVVRGDQRMETAPMTPWREPERDMRAFLPGATGHLTDICILSGQRLELTRRLGRAPAPEENALYLYPVHGVGSIFGTVAVQRVKGEYGGIELVLATGPDGRVKGVRIQRSREPERVTEALGRFLPAFKGKSASDAFKPGEDLPQLPETARVSGQAIAEGVRSLLILEDVGREHHLSQPEEHAHHAPPGRT